MSIRIGVIREGGLGGGATRGGAEEEEETVGASTSAPSAIDIGEHNSIPSTHYLTLGAGVRAEPSTAGGRPGKHPIIFSRKKERGH